MDKPKIWSSYIEYGTEQLYIPSDCEFNHSNAWETIEKRSTDNTKTIHNVTVLKQKGRQPNMYTVTFTLYQKNETESLWTLLRRYEDLVGKNVDLTYLNIPFLGLVVESGTFAFANDGIQGVIALTITLNLRESAIVSIKKEQVRTRQS